jgi:hypothetical protein
LAAPSHQLRQGLAIGISERARVWSDAFGKQGNDLSVEGVGFGEPPGGAGKVPDLPWIDNGDWKMGAGQSRSHCGLEPTAGLKHYQGWGQLS